MPEHKREEILSAIRDAGVVGAGGAGLPAHVKMRADAAPSATPVDTVLVNGAACEPLLMSDPWLMEQRADELARGLLALLACTGAARGVFCLKSKHAEALAAVSRAARADDRLAVFTLRDFYPAGDEQVLVREALGRTVPERGLPLHVGAVVCNVETLLNVDQALAGAPVTHRYLTVTGEVRRPGVFKAPVGMAAADILAAAGGLTRPDALLVDGGPMMGKVLADAKRPITKTTSGLIALPPDHPVVAKKIMNPERLRRLTTTICCQCTQCTELCPRHLLGHGLHPHKLMRAAAAPFAPESAREALLCSECGLCEKFACPMLLSPREVNAQLKKQLAQLPPPAGQAQKQNAPHPHPFRAERAVPTARLIRRLGLAGYEAHPPYGGELQAERVSIPLKQHIGAPSVPVVTPGARVRQGDVIGDIPAQQPGNPEVMAARVHASIDGVVEAVADGMITISAHG